MLLSVSRLFQMGAGFVISVLVASHLGVTGLGIYATALTFYTIIALAGQAGAREYLVRELSRDPSLTASYTVHLSIIGAAVGIVLTGAGVLIVQHLGYSDALRVSVATILLALPPRILNTIQEAVFLAHGRVELETYVRAISFLVYVGGSALLLANGADVANILTLMVGLEYVVTAVYFVLISRVITRLALSFRRSRAVQLIREIRSYAASALLASVFSRPEIIVLSILAAETQVGLYGAATRIAELPLIFTEVFLASVFPLLSRAFGVDEQRFAKLQRVALRVLLAFSLPVAAILMIRGGDILALLFGAPFREAAPILSLLAVNIVFYSCAGLLWRTLVARGRQDLNLRIQVVTTVFRISAGVALVLPLAAVGAAAASAMTSFLHLGLATRAVRRVGGTLKFPWSSWRLVVAALAASGVAAALGGAPLILGLLGFAVTYVLLAFLIRAIDAEDRQVLRGLRRAPAAPTPT